MVYKNYISIMDDNEGPITPPHKLPPNADNNQSVRRSGSNTEINLDDSRTFVVVQNINAADTPEDSNIVR